MYNLDVVAPPTGFVVNPTFKLKQDTAVLSGVSSLGGITCVMYPVLSLAKASGLNPLDIKDFDPKLEFELVSPKSPPLSVKNWFANPIANTETAWIYELLDTFIWKFS